MERIEIQLHVAQGIQKDSWLNDPKYKWFVDAYGYASTQTLAIPALSKIPPEELYHLITIFDVARQRI